MADSQDIILQKIKDQGDLVRKLKAAKESSEKAMTKRTIYNLDMLDDHLCMYSYVCGYAPGKTDIKIAKELENIDIEKFINIKRWWYHMGSFSDSEISDLSETPPSVKFALNSIDEQVCELLKYRYV